MLKMKRDPAGIVLMILLALVFSSPAGAGLYKCTDANNRTFYQDKPCQDMVTSRLPGNLARLSGKEEERAFLWKAVGEKGTLYLMGSLYYGRQDMAPFPQMVMDAFTASNVLVVEADLRNLGEKELFNLLKGRGRYEDKTTLEVHIKQPTWSKAVAVAKKLGINQEVLGQYKPWLAALVLSSASLKQAGFTPELGIGQSFLEKSQAKKPAVEMESLEDQVNQLEELSPLEQEQMLLQTLQELGRGADYYNALVDAWRKGDSEIMDPLIRQSYDTGEASAKLSKLVLDDRNERMAIKLKELASEDKTYFIVAWAGRFGGDKGLLKLLQDKGFKVTQP